MSRIGPNLRIEASRMGCAHERSERYRVQGDSGTNVKCAHPAVGGGRYVADSHWHTPDWCPEMQPARAAFLAEQMKEGAT
ncbi:MAG: hypothetical protein MUF34_20145 [Polyangiaceae bacterium]|nr:hypothetical protein [Polyangiaceae bacterium]